MANIVQYKKHYEIFIEGRENPIEVSNEVGEAIKKDLLSQSNGFISINGTVYNRFKIERVEFYEQKLSATQIEALEWKREIDEKRKELGLI